MKKMGFIAFFTTFLNHIVLIYYMAWHKPKKYFDVDSSYKKTYIINNFFVRHLLL